jgi:hypothetical protein
MKQTQSIVCEFAARLAGIVAEKKTAVWINHDLPTFDSLKHSQDVHE